MYTSDEDEFRDMEGIDLDVSVDRVLKDNDDDDDNKRERLSWFGGRALSFGLAIVALIAAAVGVAVWLRKDNKQAIPSGISSSDASIPVSTLSQRNSVDDCWVALYGNVYNLTNYNHPGPQAWISSHCGSDATAEYSAVHPQVYMRTIEHLYVGVYESDSVSASDENDTASNNNSTTDGPMNDGSPNLASNSSNSSNEEDPPGVSNNLPTGTSTVQIEGVDDIEIINGPFYNTSAADDEDDVKDDENQPVNGGIFGNIDEENAADRDKENNNVDKDNNKEDERTFDVQGEDADKKKEKIKTKEKDKNKDKKKKDKNKDAKKKKN